MASESNGDKAISALWCAIKLIVIGIGIAGGTYALHATALAHTDTATSANREHIYSIERRVDRRDEEMKYLHNRVDEMHGDIKAIRKAVESRGWLKEGDKP